MYEGSLHRRGLQIRLQPTFFFEHMAFAEFTLAPAAWQLGMLTTGNFVFLPHGTLVGPCAIIKSSPQGIVRSMEWDRTLKCEFVSQS